MDLLVTARLRLRAWAEADLPAFFDIYSRDEVTRWLGPQPRRSVADLAGAGRGYPAGHARRGHHRPLVRPDHAPVPNGLTSR